MLKDTKIFSRKVKLAWKVLRSKTVPAISYISSDDKLKAEIRNSIYQVAGAPTSANNEQFYMNLCDTIYNKVKQPSDLSTSEKVGELASGIFQNQLWYFCILSGLASLWEFRVKLLAARLGVQTKKERWEKNKKQINTKVIVYKDLSEIASEIKKKTNGHLDLGLTHDMKLRNAISHGNFQQLRVIFNLPSKKIKDAHKGNVFVLNLTSQNPKKKILNLSDSLSEADREEQDILGWLLEGTNSILLKEVFNHFELKIQLINKLIEFNAISFDGREVLFKKVIENGEKLSSNEIKIYHDWAKDSVTHCKLNIEHLLEDIYPHLKK